MERKGPFVEGAERWMGSWPSGWAEAPGHLREGGCWPVGVALLPPSHSSAIPSGVSSLEDIVRRWPWTS